MGHGCKAVHDAYAKGAVVICPALEEYEAMRERKIVPMPLRIDLTATEMAQPARSYI